MKGPGQVVIDWLKILEEAVVETPSTPPKGAKKPDKAPSKVSQPRVRADLHSRHPPPP
jgi:hypothetical protein